MSFVDTLRQWDEAVACVDKAHLSQALEILVAIQEPNSKISFNIGCLHLNNQDLDAAEKAFDRSIGKDEHLAIAFFQRGITFYKKESYEESFADFQNAFKRLRGNQLIDYKALGLRHKLYACEVLHNMALSQAHLGHWKKAQEHLVAALNYNTESKLNLIDRALQSTLKQNLFKPATVPAAAMFRPNKNHVAELEKKDYLGKSKVVSSIIPQDAFSGFAPLQPQVEDGPTGPKAPEVLRAFEGEPHIVRFEFVPKTSGELAVVPGNIVFVLQKGADNWVSVVFNERAADDGESSACIVKVHYIFNLAFHVTCGSPYATLLERISKKLQQPGDSITLSCTSPAAGLTVMDASTDMQAVWSSANCGRITLWCDVKKKEEVKEKEEEVKEKEEEVKEKEEEVKEKKEEVKEKEEEVKEKVEEKEEPLKDNPGGVQVHVIALHSYESPNPEDLTFSQGDTILLLAKVNQDWFEGQCNGDTGIFPAAFVEVPADAQ
ncbi:hypothetical protein CRUP_038285 [Coryphaenoides rupestris]|nr:hypothetical protein CRUP_038285 [Coryphaenoides rupestris]